MKITYILGAGASANALPMVKTYELKPNELKPSLADSLIAMANVLEKTGIEKSHEQFVRKLISNFYDIASESKRFGTTDTFAKFLFLKGEHKKLDDLKEALIIYFTIEQIINQKIDDRPLTFLTTVMEHGFKFPDQIKIISWNFDYQIQLASNAFRRENFEVSKGATVHSPPLITYYPPLGVSGHISQEEISMIQMNGIAGFYEQGYLTLNYFVTPPDDLNELFKRIKEQHSQKANLLTFAWEKNSATARFLTERITIAKKIASGTEILVVIGYSFPFFNREIDKEIFQAIKDSTTLKKIYFQDPFNDGEFLRNQFDLGEELDIEHIVGADNYFVPMEL